MLNNEEKTIDNIWLGLRR